ncbi:MAG: DUF2845 domain-containing protein [Deltaproteobacteria bacterium]|nr:DUF2845 domain-containing protein [Deltaproteobacteria bacterium]
MKKSIILVGLFFSLLVITLIPTDVFAFRCGVHLVKTGDKTFEVIQRCGDPVSKETVGYTLTTTGKRRELEIKEWIYGPTNGYYYYLTFHGTTLVNIESRRE